MKLEINRSIKRSALIFCMLLWIPSLAQNGICDDFAFRSSGREMLLNILPIGNNSKIVKGTEFTIANNFNTYDILCKHNSVEYNNASKPVEDIINEEIGLHNEIHRLLSVNIDELYCTITTSFPTTLSLSAYELPSAYLGMFAVNELSNSSSVIVEQLASENICGHGMLRILNTDDIYAFISDRPVVYEPICDLDAFSMELEAESVYIMTFVSENNSHQEGTTGMLFALPFNASREVTVQCGFDIQRHVPPLTPSPDDSHERNSESAVSDRVGDEEDVSPELIALIAVVALIFIVGVVLLTVFIQWRRRHLRKKKSKHSTANPESEIEGNDYGRYETITETLARENTYQKEPGSYRRPTYESINSMNLSNPYEEIPADSQENVNAPGNETTIMQVICEESMPSGDVDKNGVNLNELYAKPLKRTSLSVANKNDGIDGDYTMARHDEVKSDVTNQDELYAKVTKGKPSSTDSNDVGSGEGSDCKGPNNNEESYFDIDDPNPKLPDSNLQGADKNNEENVRQGSHINENVPDKSEATTTELAKNDIDLEIAKHDSQAINIHEHDKLQKVDSVLRMIENDAYISD